MARPLSGKFRRAADAAFCSSYARRRGRRTPRRPTSFRAGPAAEESQSNLLRPLAQIRLQPGRRDSPDQYSRGRLQLQRRGTCRLGGRRLHVTASRFETERVRRESCRRRENPLVDLAVVVRRPAPGNRASELNVGKCSRWLEHFTSSASPAGRSRTPLRARFRSRLHKCPRRNGRALPCRAVPTTPPRGQDWSEEQGVVGFGGFEIAERVTDHKDFVWSVFAGSGEFQMLRLRAHLLAGNDLHVSVDAMFGPLALQRLCRRLRNVHRVRLLICGPAQSQVWG